MYPKPNPCYIIQSLWLLEQRHEFMIQTAKQTQQLRQLEDVFLNNTVLDSQLNTVNFNNQF